MSTRGFGAHTGHEVYVPVRRQLCAPYPHLFHVKFHLFHICMRCETRTQAASVLCWALLLRSLAARPSPPFCFAAAAAFLLCLNCVVSSLISNNSRISVTLPTGRAVVTAECGAALQPTTWAIAWLTVSCLVCYIACGLLWLYFSFFPPL